MNIRKIFSKDLTIVILFVIITGILVASAFWAYHEFMTSPPHVDDVKYPVRGIDISAHNGEIDFNKVAQSGIEFVFIKVSEGGDFNDRNFVRNYEGARGAGLKTGFYHFFRFDRDGIVQALNFVRTIGSRKSDLGLAIDVEKDGNKTSVPKELIVKHLTSMVEYLNLLGYRVTFYTNLEGYYDYIAENFPGAPLWICRFKENPVNAEWTFWQYSHSGIIEGIEGKVDLDAFCGTRKEWEAFLNGAVWPYTD